ncbi:MAG: hypothetical protein A2498_14835 [Lentisphaerae bacterium RIFOXYC12_FULL_60_16]|nr:MAG: hypothetical protein A2498_14835 [Lentisphaerae bacterium RIFOXYC12_FULL_60_16]OGV84019.1 MAG: hypothetical protein A2340_09180 [Lentisphaerae bacterium RIFOXYB12_FULL_60_10]
MAILVGVIGILVLIGVPVTGINMLKQYRILKRTPLIKPGRVSPGYLAVKGKTVSCVKYITPFTRKPAVYCEAKADKMRFQEDGKVNSRIFDTIYEEHTNHPFFVEDETGRLLVDPREGFVDIVGTYHHETFLKGGSKVKVVMPPEPVRITLDEARIPYALSDGPFPLRLEESAIAEGSPVFAMGYCTNDPKAIEEALSGVEGISKWSVIYVLKNGAGNQTRDQLYVSPGDDRSTSRSLLINGWMLIVFGLLGGLVLVAVAVIMRYG